MIHKQKFETEQYDLQTIFTFKEITDQEYNSCSSYKDEGPLLESCGNKKKNTSYLITMLISSSAPL